MRSSGSSAAQKDKQKQATKQQPEKIPPIGNIAPSVFVPIEGDFLADFQPPQDRMDRLKRILQSIDYQRAGVKENLMWLFEREKRRIIQEATEKELSFPPTLREAKPGLRPEEADRTIWNMESRAKPGVDYNVKDLGMLQRDPNLMRYPPDPTLRDRAVAELMALVEKGLSELEGYDNHMQHHKGYYLQFLQKEAARIAEAGLRPEQRGSGSAGAGGLSGGGGVTEAPM